MLAYATEPDAAGNRVVVCSNCQFTRTTHWPVERIHHQCRVPSFGPGAELAKLIASLGMTRKSGCGCDEMIARMNVWGIAGCRAHRPEIIEHLRKAYDAATALDKLRALGNTLWQGGSLTLDGLLDEAITRAARSAKPPSTPSASGSVLE